ncbi:MAG TPA: rhodanese-like domain-containing protein [Candidatus Nanopelagicaceae bacterium]|nr:rhodanese-like domain-containing protein [Candidatus Nanopelagicaceae bacterium]
MGILRFLRAPKVVQINIVDFAAAHRAGCVVVDVREPSEYARGHVAGAKSMPLRHVARRGAELPQDQVIHVICASGHRSRVAARMLEASGLEVRSVAGGTAAWVRQKLPLVAGAKPGRR